MVHFPWVGSMRTCCAAFLLACAFPLSLSAQSPTFLDASQWFLFEVNPSASSYDWYQTGKDSTINGEAYVQALQGYDPMPIWLREESGTQRVFANGAWNGWAERLLYDFSLVAGDTVPLDFKSGGRMRFVVDNVDAVNTTMGFIPRINLRNIDGIQPLELQWSPGVGAFSHPFYLDLPNSSDTSYSLVCNYHDGQKQWEDGFGTCPSVAIPLSAASVPGLEDLGLTLFPDHFSLQAPPNLELEVRLLDLQGRTLLERSLGQGQYYESESSFASGIYILMVRSGERELRRKWLLR